MTTISAIRSKVFDALKSSRCDEYVLSLIENGNGSFEQEDYLWDYKQKIGLDSLDRGSDNYKSKICEVVKDIAAFHNTFGGYIVFGVEDKSRTFVGFDEQFPFDEVVNRIRSDLKKKIDITFREMNYRGGVLVLVHIPSRSELEEPKSFEKDAKSNEKGKCAYKTGQVFYRDWQASSPAAGDALVSLIAGSYEVPGIRLPIKIDQLTIHNLPGRDFNLKDFIGRDDYLDQLWIWMLDKFVPLRIVTGIGGLGKTTLVRRFSEDVLSKSPGNLQGLLWYSAKSVSYNAQLARFEKKNPSDPNYFNSPFALYDKILVDLGKTDEEIEEIETSSEYIQEMIVTLNLTPSLIVVDDLDSLGEDEQAQIFQELGIVFSRTAANLSGGSRCILTARQLVGAMPSQTIKLQGFEKADFRAYIEALYRNFDLKFSSISKSPKLLDKFLKISGGSPLFASAIVRLVHQGFNLDNALNRFTGKDGQEVRSFTFERELEKLQESQLRCLYALINLSPCSSLELSQALEVSEDQLFADISGLRDFHLISRQDAHSARGREFYVESYIQLLRSLVEEKIRDPRRIEKSCKRIRHDKKAKTEDVSKIIGQVLSLWRNEEYEGALSYIINQEEMRSSEAFTPDLHCIAGRAFLRVEPPRSQDAARRFRIAYDGGCSRPELYDLWIEAHEVSKDWISVIEVAKLAITDTSSTKYYQPFGRAGLEQATILSSSGDHQSAIDILQRTGVFLNSAFSSNRTSPAASPEIASLRNQCFDFAMNYAATHYSTSSSKIKVFDVGWSAFENFCRSSRILRTAVDAARIWGEYVKVIAGELRGGDKSKFDETIGRLTEMHQLFEEKEWSDKELVEKTERVIKYLISTRDILLK